MPTTSQPAYQSVELGQLMDAIGTVLQFSTGYNAAAVIESWLEDPRTKYEGRDCVVYRLVGQLPMFRAGAGRLGTPNDITLQVRVFSRLDVDQAGQQKYLGRKNWAMRQKIVDGFQVGNLFTAYNMQTQQPADNAFPLLVVPWQQIDSPYGDAEKTDSTWGLGALYLKTKTVLPLTVTVTT